MNAAAAAAGIVLLAAALHWGLRRLSRRLPLWLARLEAAGGSPQVAVEDLWRRRLGVAFLIPKTAVWMAAVWALAAVLPALERLSGRVLAAARTALAGEIPLGDASFTLGELLLVPALLGLLWIAVGLLVGFVRLNLARVLGPGADLPDNLLTLLRYALLAGGAILVFSSRGIDVRTLLVAASVLGVGIGFGLQNIANNFVSGILIGLERPIRTGDFVKVGEFTGTVQRVGARSTAVTTLDRVTILVPNSRILETEVVNWSYGDPRCRLHVPVAVAYGSHLARVRAALLEAAASLPRLLRDPRPEVQFLGFGDSGLELELLAWIADPRQQNPIRSDLCFAVDAAFRRYGIEVPFPQRDLHLRSPVLDQLVDAARLRLAEEAGAEAAALAGAAPPRQVATPELPRIEPAAHDEASLAALVERLRGPGGVAIADRRHLLTLHRHCFLGRELVDWLVREESLTRSEAVAVGGLLAERRLLHHVLDEHPFLDSGYFYRFYADEAVAPAVSASDAAAGAATEPAPTAG